MFLRGSALRRSYDDHWAGLAPETARGPEPRPPEANQPSPLIEPAEPIPTRARTSAFGRLRHWPWRGDRWKGAGRWCQNELSRRPDPDQDLLCVKSSPRLR